MAQAIARCRWDCWRSRQIGWVNQSRVCRGEESKHRRGTKLGLHNAGYLWDRWCSRKIGWVKQSNLCGAGLQAMGAPDWRCPTLVAFGIGGAEYRFTGLNTPHCANCGRQALWGLQIGDAQHWLPLGSVVQSTDGLCHPIESVQSGAGTVGAQWGLQIGAAQSVRLWDRWCKAQLGCAIQSCGGRYYPQ